MSSTIKNEMIECLRSKLENDLLEQIRASPHMTSSENGQPVDIEVREVFLGFYAADLVKQATTLFICKNIDLKKCIGSRL